jgi:hypothetical protein
MGFSCDFESLPYLNIITWLKEKTETDHEAKVKFWQAGPRIFGEFDSTTGQRINAQYVRFFTKSLGVNCFYRIFRYTGNGWYAQLQIKHVIAPDGDSEPMQDIQTLGIEDEMLAIELKLTFSQVTSEPYVRTFF